MSNFVKVTLNPNNPSAYLLLNNGSNETSIQLPILNQPQIYLSNAVRYWYVKTDYMQEEPNFSIYLNESSIIKINENSGKDSNKLCLGIKDIAKVSFDSFLNQNNINQPHTNFLVDNPQGNIFAQFRKENNKTYFEVCIYSIKSLIFLEQNKTFVLYSQLAEQLPQGYSLSAGQVFKEEKLSMDFLSNANIVYTLNNGKSIRDV